MPFWGPCHHAHTGPVFGGGSGDHRSCHNERELEHKVSLGVRSGIWSLMLRICQWKKPRGIVRLNTHRTPFSLDLHMMPIPNAIPSAAIAVTLHLANPTHLCRLTLSLTELLLQTVSVFIRRHSREEALSLGRGAHQSLHGAVQSMSVVSSEFGVGSLERGVSGGLGLLDTAARESSLAFI